VRELLEELEERLRAFGAPIAGAFRPGAAPERVRAALEAEGLPAHEDLVVWWGWHDGAAVDAPPVEDGPGIYFRPENTLVEPWHVLSLEEALRNRRWYRQLYDESGLSSLLPSDWVPVLLVDGRPVLLADTGAPGPAPLHVLDEGQLEPAPPQFESLAELARLVVRAFDDGAVRPGSQDPRAPAIDPAAAGDVRRLVHF
jgi:hypothetical protein